MDGILRGYRQNDIPNEKWELYKEIGKKYICAYSRDSFYDVMRNSHNNIMCLGILVERTENTINDPAKGLRLIKVSQTIISYDAFVLAQTKARENAIMGVVPTVDPDVPPPPIFKNPEDNYVVIGQHREYFNAVIPLYLDHEHMKRIRILEGILLGHMYTLNSYGYDKAQEVGMLKILQQMIEQRNGTELYDEYIYQFMKVCQFIVNESEGFFSVFGKDTLNKFVESFQTRTLSVVEDLGVVAMVAFAKSVDDKDMPLWKDAICSVYEHTVYKHCVKLAKTMDNVAKQEAIKELLYGNKDTVVSVCHGKIMEDSDDPDYVEQSYVDFFHDQQKTPILIIPEESNLSTCRQICEVDTDVVKKYQCELPEIIKDIFKMIGAKSSDCFDWNYEKLRKSIIIGLSYTNKIPPHVDFHNVLTVVDELIQGEFRNLSKFKMTSENVVIVARKALMSKTLEGFGGILRKYCNCRNGPIFDKIYDGLINGTINGEDVVLQKEKLYSLLSNELRYGKLYEGNIPVPQLSGKQWEQFCWLPYYGMSKVVKLLGADVVNRIANFNVSNNKLVFRKYRANCIPNRHGYSNHNPNYNSLYNFNGYYYETGSEINLNADN